MYLCACTHTYAHIHLKRGGQGFERGQVGGGKHVEGTREGKEGEEYIGNTN